MRPAPASTVVAALLLIGCTSTAVRYADRTVTSEVLHQRVSENHERVRSLAGSGTISVETPEMAQSASFELTLKKPDSLLVKIEGPFGIDVGSALVTRERFMFYSSFQNRIVEGKTSPETFGKIFQIPLNFDDVLDLFTGGIFLLEDRSEPSTFSIEDEQFVLVYSRYTGIRKYWIDPETMQISKIQHLDGSGKLVLEQLFSRFQTADGITIPYYVRLTMFRERRRMSVAYSDVTANPPGTEFHFDVPSGTPRTLMK